MSRHTLLAVLVVALVCGTANSAWAQGQIGGTTTGGGFGGATTGGSTFGNSSFGSSLGSSGTSSGSFGTTGLGSGFGSSGAGNSGFGTQGFGQSTAGSSAQGGQSFVGRDAGDMQTLFGQLGQGSNQFFQQLNRTIGGNQNRNRQAGQQENAPLLVRVRLNVAFDQPRPQPSALATNVRNRLERVLTERSITAPEIAVDGDTVTLRGTAASESQRLVIEKLVSLEPGVWTVRNLLTVADEIPSELSRPATNN